MAIDVSFEIEPVVRVTITGKDAGRAIRWLIDNKIATKVPPLIAQRIHLGQPRFIPKRRAAARRCHQPPREAQRHHRARHMARILLREFFREGPGNLLTGFGTAPGQRRENAGIQAMRLAVVPSGCDSGEPTLIPRGLDSGAPIRGEGGSAHIQYNFVEAPGYSRSQTNHAKGIAPPFPGLSSSPRQSVMRAEKT